MKNKFIVIIITIIVILGGIVLIFGNDSDKIAYYFGIKVKEK